MTTEDNHHHTQHDEDPSHPSSARATKVDFAGNVCDTSDTDDSEEHGDLETGIVKNSLPSSPKKSLKKKASFASVTTARTATSRTAVEDPSEYGTVTVVSNLDVYYGSTLELKIDSFIASHPVVMFNKTFCLFSMDAQEFLTKEVKTSLHIIQVDMIPKGNTILKYVQKKTQHRTMPIIFVRGQFLGGFQDVNDMYTSGRLQSEYLTDLSHGAKVNAFVEKSQVDILPMFWYPVKVDANVIRAVGVMTCLISLVSFIAGLWYEWGHYIAYGLFFDYVLRFFGGYRFSPLGNIGILLTSKMEPNLRFGRPKQFAAFVCGSIVGSACIFFLLNFPTSDYVGSAIMGSVVIGAAMEGFLDFCLGWCMFEMGVKAGVFRK